MGFFGRRLGRDRQGEQPGVVDTPAILEQRLQASGLTIGGLSVPGAVTQVLSFYREVRVADCALDADGDMLLFQWGVYDWGGGPSFQFDLTRQFISGVDDDAIRQLSLVLQFAPSEQLRALTPGNRWCHSPAQLPEFETFVRRSEAYLAVVEAMPDRVEFDLQSV